mmetsp:Transcript_13860/g.13819  ORF Transcript_13860/g.13819 Transcript_13860/m.13819 type:complete len:93 (+) Transcript_13860:1810-2088(+)
MKESGQTPETNQIAKKPLFDCSDSMVNIKEEDLRECPDNPNLPEGVQIQFFSFKPGISVDNRIIPATPGGTLKSVSTKNKPRIIKQNLMNAI